MLDDLLIDDLKEYIDLAATYNYEFSFIKLSYNIFLGSFQGKDKPSVNDFYDLAFSQYVDAKKNGSSSFDSVVFALESVVDDLALLSNDYLLLDLYK